MERPWGRSRPRWPEGRGGTGPQLHGDPQCMPSAVRGQLRVTPAVYDFHLCGLYSSLGNGDKALMGVVTRIKNQTQCSLP